jgi:hypothetical protein
MRTHSRDEAENDEARAHTLQHSHVRQQDLSEYHTESGSERNRKHDEGLRQQIREAYRDIHEAGGHVVKVMNENRIKAAVYKEAGGHYATTYERTQAAMRLGVPVVLGKDGQYHCRLPDAMILAQFGHDLRWLTVEHGRYRGEHATRTSAAGFTITNTGGYGGRRTRSGPDPFDSILRK